MLTFTVSPGLALGMWYCDTNSPSPVINDNLHRFPKGLKPVFFTFHDMGNLTCVLHKCGQLTE